MVGHYEAYQKQYGDDDVRIRRKMIEENLLDAVMKKEGADSSSLTPEALPL